MLGFFKKSSHNEDVAVIKRALSPKVVVVVSASCCMQGTAEVDARAEASAREAIQLANLDWPVMTVTVTQAQAALGRIAAELDTAQGALAAQVSELFMSHGLNAFPVLLVNQKLVSYGGAPDHHLIRASLPPTSGGTPRMAAHEDIA